jgi:hypothetical protein
MYDNSLRDEIGPLATGSMDLVDSQVVIERKLRACDHNAEQLRRRAVSLPCCRIPACSESCNPGNHGSYETCIESMKFSFHVSSSRLSKGLLVCMVCVLPLLPACCRQAGILESVIHSGQKPPAFSSLLLRYARRKMAPMTMPLPTDMEDVSL